MRVLFVSGELIAGDIALRLQREGADVRLYTENPIQRECLDGYVAKVSDWKSELAWVGRDGLIVFDDVGFGDVQDCLRQDGYRVFGGSRGGDRLELDRPFGQRVLADCGISVAPTYDFANAREAKDFVVREGGAWVVKQNDHQSHLNYVGVMPDGSDVAGVLDTYARLGITNLTLQRRIDGVEISVGRFFNGREWLGPLELDMEHKGLMNQDIGPKTGEMGNLMWYVPGETNRLFGATLKRLEKYLRSANFRGDISINCFVNADSVVPIEITARLGCPIVHAQTSLHTTAWSEIFAAVADGKSNDLSVSYDYAISLTLAVPPFPFGGDGSIGVVSAGLPVFFRSELTVGERKRLHLEGVCCEKLTSAEMMVLTPSLGYAAFVTGTGATVSEAQRSVYDLASKIVIPKVMYRTDIGDRFLAGDYYHLKRYGWV